MKQKRRSWIVIALFLLALGGSVISMSFYCKRGNSDAFMTGQRMELTGWNYELEDGTGGQVTLPCDLPVGDGASVRYTAVLPDTVTDHEWISLYVRSTFKIYINGELRKEFDEEALGYPGSIEKSTYVFCELTREDAGAKIEIFMESAIENNGFLRKVYLGDSFGILYTILYGDFAHYIGILILLAISVIGLLVGLLLSIQKKTDANIVYISTGIMLVCVWLLLDGSLYQFIFPNNYVDGVGSFLMAMLAPFPFMVYVDKLQRERYHTVFVSLEIFDLCYFFIVCVLRFGFGVVLSRNLLFYNLPIILMAVAIFFPIIRDVISGECREYLIITYGLGGLLILSTLEIIFINLSPGGNDGNLILGGLFVLAIAALFQQLHDSMSLFQTLNQQTRKIHEMSENNRSLTTRAQSDPLTGIFNSAYLRQEVSRRITQNSVGTLLLFDLDNFKQINDTYGHQIGDRVLIAFAGALKRAFRTDDIVARLGGDEFVVFLSERVSQQLVEYKRGGIQEYVRKELYVEPYRDLVGFSMGAAFVPEDAANFDKLYKMADDNMYAEKNRKHGR